MNEKLRTVNPEFELLRDTILNFLVPLVVLVVAIGAGVLVIYPAYKAMPGLKVKVEEQTSVRNSLATKKAALEKLVDFKSVVEENANILNTLLESESKVPELLNQIDIIAKAAGMDVTKLSYQLASRQQQQTGTVNVVEVSMSTASSFEQLVQFLGLIEKAARVITVVNLRYTFDQKDTQIYNSNFSFESPYLMIESKAVTDEPINVDITSEEFTDFMKKVKGYTYYESNVPIFPIPLENQQFSIDEEGNAVITSPTNPAETLINSIGSSVPGSGLSGSTTP